VKEIIIHHGRGFNLNAKVEDQVLAFDDKGNLMGVQINHETAMYCAAYNGHADVVRLLLQARASGAILARNGWSPIFAACKRNHTEVVRLLIAAKVDVTVRNKNDMTCINIAAFNGNLEITKMLIAADKTVAIAAASPTVVKTEGTDPTSTELVVAPPLTSAQLTATFINQPDKLGARPLHAAVQNKHFEVVQWLLQYGADVNVITTTLISPLYVAAFNGNLQVVEWLLQRGAAVDQANSDGLTPLLVAAYNGRTDCVKRLVEAGANLEMFDKKNKYVLLFKCLFLI
jgi:ankyrin repeat protein